MLAGLDYRVPPGMTILLGPNGAGKSTLLKLAASVVTPTRGTMGLAGFPYGSRAYRAAVAWMPQTITPLRTLTAREYVAYVGWLTGMARADAWDRSPRALERVEMADLAGVRTTRLSCGQPRRVGLAGALVHDARVLLLDEPTAGLDPRQRRVFRTVLAGLGDGITVLLSTHDVVDLAEEADSVTVLKEGRLLHSGAPRRSWRTRRWGRGRVGRPRRRTRHCWRGWGTGCDEGGDRRSAKTICHGGGVPGVVRSGAWSGVPASTSGGDRGEVGCGERAGRAARPVSVRG